MKDNGLFDLFVEELADMYSSEHQIIATLPKLIQAASQQSLKDALSAHLKETQQQVVRIEKIFQILKMQPYEEECEAMKGLLKEGGQLLSERSKSPALDAAIIAACQKVEHYEIASYGTLKAFAKQLEFDSKIVDLLEDTLKEEGGADKKLTKIAEGTLFSAGVNEEAEEEVTHRKAKK